MSKDNKKEYALWIIFGNEETPLGLVISKTEGGALRRYSEETGKSRHSIYTEKADISYQKKVLRFPTCS
jgi:hypothetical protein